MNIRAIVDAEDVRRVCEAALDVLRAHLLDAGFFPQGRRTQVLQRPGQAELVCSCVVELNQAESSSFEVMLALCVDETKGVLLTLRAHEAGRSSLDDSILWSHHLADWPVKAFFQSLAQSSPCPGVFYAADTAVRDFFAPHHWAPLQSELLLPVLQP